MCRLAKPKPNKANSSNLYPPTKGYFRETCKPQNINLISPTHNFNWIKAFSGDDLYKLTLTVKSLSFNCFVILFVLCLLFKICLNLQLLLVLSSIKIYLSVQFQYLKFQHDPEVRGVCKVKVFASILVYTFSLSFDMQHDHLLKKVLTFLPDPTGRMSVCVRTEYMLALCSMPHYLSFDMHHDYFQKKCFALLTQPQGTRVCVRTEYVLV